MKKILKVPPYIKRLVLTQYVMQCRELYQIAFFQWRKMYPSKCIFDLEQIEEILEFRIGYTFKPEKKENGIPNTQTLKDSEPSLYYITKYDMLDLRDVHYKINTFSQINFPDPFPKENTFKSKRGPPKDMEDQVYLPECFRGWETPFCYYLPRKEMMFKLMRGCINVETPD